MPTERRSEMLSSTSDIQLFQLENIMGTDGLVEGTMVAMKAPIGELR